MAVTSVQTFVQNLSHQMCWKDFSRDFNGIGKYIEMGLANDKVTTLKGRQVLYIHHHPVTFYDLIEKLFALFK